MQQNDKKIIKCSEVFYMNKNLPNVYAVPITKQMKNNEEIFKSAEVEGLRSTPVNSSLINKIFNDKTHVYKTRVQITTASGKKEVDVVGETKTSLLTLTGETINISDILDIKKV